MTLATKTAARDEVQEHAHAHTHDHAPKHAGHDHAGHDHAGHDHANHNHGAHANIAVSAPRRANPGFSLLRTSSLQRLALALTLVAAIWLGVFWAWS